MRDDAPSPAEAERACNHRVAMSFGRTNQDARPHAEMLTLNELSARFAVPDTTRGQLKSAEYHALDKRKPAEKKRRDQEKNGEYFVAAHFGGNGRRAAENIVELSGFVLDFDSGRTLRATIEAKLAGTAYLAHTSYSHRPAEQRWRVFVPYAMPLARRRHEAVFTYFNALFDSDLDEHCKNPAQIYYTPACPPDAVHEYEHWFAEGTLFDPTATPQQSGEGDRGVELAEGNCGAEAVCADLARLADALTYVDPDPRESWIEVGMALKHDHPSDGLPLWLKWSQRSRKFEMEGALETWTSLKPSTGDAAITTASIFHRATQAGWTPLAANGIPAEIAELNEQHFVAPYGRKALVFRRSRDPVDGRSRYEPMAPPDFRLLLSNRRAPVMSARGKISNIPLADHWLGHAGRRQYEGVVFSPGQDVPGYFNLWQGFAVEPRPGAWALMRKHIFEVICAGDARHAEYLLNWMAYAVQHPGLPAEVAIVLMGARGTGKGIVARSFGNLFGPHFLQISQPRHLTGNFNGHLEGCAVLFVDEGFWAGDKAGEGVLKGLVTEPTLSIERKGLDVIRARNCLHIIIASNSDWVVPAGPDERRFFVLNVAEGNKQDQAYFAPLYAEMDGEGLPAMLHDLLRRDLSGFDVRQVPPSKALAEQKLQTLSPTEKWWFDKLVAGEFSMGSPPFTVAVPWGEVPTATVQLDYVHALGRAGTSRKSTETELGRGLGKLLPPGRHRTRPKRSGAQVPHYDFPSLAECRSLFETRMGMGGKIDWDSGGILD